MTFNELQKKRRSIYQLGDKLTQTPEEIHHMVNEALREAPSAMNSQSVRVLVLTGEYHKKLWDMTLDRLKAVAKSEEAFAKTAAKINGAFKSGFGTVLYFTDTSVVTGLEEAFPAYADNFYDWSEQAIGISTYAVWLTFAENGIGASNQHYNPLIDADVAREFDVPDTWKLRAEMPFGSIEGPAGEKDYIEDSVRSRLLK